MGTMSRAEIEKHHAKLSKKRKLTRREETELMVLGAVLFQGGRITAQRDYTERRRGWW